MANTNAIPSLTETGFITNKNLQMSKLFSYFMASDYSQSNLFHGSIASLKYLLAQNTDPRDFVTSLESTLNRLYSNYFEKVETIVDTEETEGGIVNVYIDIKCTDNDGEYYLRREIATKEGNMVEFEKSMDELYEVYGG